MICKMIWKSKDTPDNDNPSNDNIDTDKPDDHGVPKAHFSEGKKELFYPSAIKYEDSMRTRGTYKNDYPRGAVIHYTAGRGRKAPEGGKRAYDTHKAMGAKSVKSALKKGSYCYFVNDLGGNIHQPFSLDRWGYHAGKSSWPSISGSVSDELVGIENQGAGKLDHYKGDTYKAYFTTTSKGDGLFQAHEVRKKDGKYWHKFTEAQERGLVELLLWLKRNNPSVFSFDLVVGHDEVSPGRKPDPGGSLSMSMPKFRDHLKAEYIRRYGSLS